jgi:mycothione reductase
LVSVFDVAVIGSGSGNVVVPDDRLGLQTALIETGPFGGTCINRGCIPSKMLVHTADLADNVREAALFGFDTAIVGIDWPAIRDRVFTKIDRTSEEGREERRDVAGVTLFEGHAKFTGPHELEVNGTAIEAEHIVIATGGRPSLPRVVAESGVEFYTSDTIMRLEKLPSSMVILGGGSIAAEMAHIFSALGVSVKIISQASVLVEALDPEISHRFTLEAHTRWSLHLNAEVMHVARTKSGVEVSLDHGPAVSGEMLLVATGRQPNTDDLGLETTRVVRRDHGQILVDEFGRAAPGVWALGDVSSPYELKHVANAEARTVAHNLSHPDDLRQLPHDSVPFAIFTKPQIASVGARSQDLEGQDFVEAIQEFSDTAYGWALQDRVGFCKLYADPVTGKLLGAHILGHQASLLITPLIQAVAHGQRVADLARGQYWIHPALSEVVENALLKLPVDHQVESGRHT